MLSEFSEITDVAQIIRIILRFLLAAILGGLLGYDREIKGKAAGLRTHMLVSFGAALFVLIPQQSGASIADLTRTLVQNAAMAVAGSHVVTHHDGRQADLGGQWKQISLYDAISNGVGESVTALTPHADLKKIAEKLGMKIDPKWITGKLAEEIFEHVARHELVEPTFVMGFPVDTSPLVRAHRELPGVAEKWDLYIDGFELATGYSELIDPVVQRDRLVEQATLGSKGDLEAMQVDEDFLRAMEFAMPPTGGMGMGVDRLLMALTGLGIRETILFPLVKPEID